MRPDDYQVNTLALLAVCTALSLGCGGGGSSGGASPVGFSNGTFEASPLPSPTGSPASPVVSDVSHDVVVAPGSTLSGQFQASDPQADVDSVLIAVDSQLGYNMFPVTGTPSVNQRITFTLDLSMASPQGIVKCRIGVMDDSGNISNYLPFSFILNPEEALSVLAHGGDTPPDISGTRNE